jgi:hypothetical protein
MSVADLKLRFPIRQEQLKVGGGEVADGSRPQPVAEAAQRIRVLTPRRGGTATPTKVAVEALEKLSGRDEALFITTHYVDSSKNTQDRPPVEALRSHWMGRPRLAGLAEVSEMLGVNKRSASRYARRSDFPEPLARLSSGPIWDAAEVEAWGAAHGPFRPGRPAKRAK